MDNKLLKTTAQHFLKGMESEFSETFLQGLLQMMGLVIRLDGDFRRNVDGFKGRYQFLGSDGAITVAAIFDGKGMEVCEGIITDPDITVSFKDGKALMSFLLAPKPDILGSMLRQEVRLSGNLNYLYKFAYMAKHLQLMATGAL